MADNEDWTRVWEAERLARSDRGALLAYLPQLRDKTSSIKQRVLDTIGEQVALASADQPTLAECREAIGEPDDQPRRRWIDSPTPVTDAFEERFVTFLLEALGGSGEPQSRTPRVVLVPPELSAWGGSSAEWSQSGRWSVETASCTIELEPSASYFPGDVNEPARSSHWIEIKGARRDHAIEIRMGAQHGDKTIWIEVAAELAERDRALARFWRAFGKR